MRKQTLSKPNTIFVAVIILLIVIIILLVKFPHNRIEFKPEGWIVYRTIVTESSSGEIPDQFNYFIMDGNGNQIQWLGNFRGNPSWSPDGNYIAVSCNQSVNKLCIIDVSTIPDLTTWPLADDNASFNPDFEKIIDLPDDCTDLISPIIGLDSISWANDGERIAVVCGDQDYFQQREDNIEIERIVCVFGLDDESETCWGDVPFSILEAYWSPVEDLLVVSRVSEIETDISNPKNPVYKEDGYELYLVGPEGDSPKFLVKGTAPAWSPDGKRIAFIAANHSDNNNEYTGSGIGIIEKDGSGFQWLLKYDEIVNFNTRCDYGCKLSWSPDGRFLVFSGEILFGYGNSHLFRLDIDTGELINLSFAKFSEYYYSVPDWGLPNKVW